MTHICDVLLDINTISYDTYVNTFLKCYEEDDFFVPILEMYKK